MILKSDTNIIADMNVLMIHEITPEILKIPEEKYKDFDIISFDDGLYTQYLNLKHFLKLGKPLYFSISTGIVCPDIFKQSTEVIYCGDAHKKAFRGNFENYMNWNQIKEIYNTPNCYISGHSHSHKMIKGIKNNALDTNKMLEIFKNHDIKIDTYCYPYNNHNFFRTLSVKANGITKFLGKERIPIESI